MKKKVAILGGGVGGMTAAFDLTNDPDWKDRFDEITVYQLGWRLGGKGASDDVPTHSEGTALGPDDGEAAIFKGNEVGVGANCGTVAVEAKFVRDGLAGRCDDAGGEHDAVFAKDAAKGG